MNILQKLYPFDNFISGNQSLKIIHVNSNIVLILYNKFEFWHHSPENGSYIFPTYHGTSCLLLLRKSSYNSQTIQNRLRIKNKAWSRLYLRLALTPLCAPNLPIKSSIKAHSKPSSLWKRVEVFLPTIVCAGAFSFGPGGNPSASFREQESRFCCFFIIYYLFVPFCYSPKVNTEVFKMISYASFGLNACERKWRGIYGV